TRLACAAAPAFDWTSDQLFDAITRNREIAVDAVIAANAVAQALLEFLGKRDPDPTGYLWSGSATDLLKHLAALVPPTTVKSSAWPKTAHHLSGGLKRLAPALRRRRVEIVMVRKGKNRNRKLAFRITEVGPEQETQTASAASAASAGNDY